MKERKGYSCGFVAKDVICVFSCYDVCVKGRCVLHVGCVLSGQIIDR